MKKDFSIFVLLIVIITVVSGCSKNIESILSVENGYQINEYFSIPEQLPNEISDACLNYLPEDCSTVRVLKKDNDNCDDMDFYHFAYFSQTDVVKCIEVSYNVRTKEVMLIDKDAQYFILRDKHLKKTTIWETLLTKFYIDAHYQGDHFDARCYVLGGPGHYWHYISNLYGTGFNDKISSHRSYRIYESGPDGYYTEPVKIIVYRHANFSHRLYIFKGSKDGYDDNYVDEGCNDKISSIMIEFTYQY